MVFEKREAKAKRASKAVFEKRKTKAEQVYVPGSHKLDGVSEIELAKEQTQLYRVSEIKHTKEQPDQIKANLLTFACGAEAAVRLTIYSYVIKSVRKRLSGEKQREEKKVINEAARCAREKEKLKEKTD